jgi:hypothetical protein
MVYCLSINAQKDKSYHNHWHEAGIDDFRSESAEFQYSEKGKFTYCISNDKENIFLNLRFIDKNVQRQVMSSGVTVWINTDGKKSKKMGIRYPVRPQNSEDRGSPENQNMQNRPGGIGNMPDMNAGMIEMIGFSDIEKKIIPNNESGGFRGSLKTEKSGCLLYELVLPFSKLPAISDQSIKKDESPFVIGLSYHSVPEMGGPSGGGGGMPGGGMPGGGMSGGGGGGRSGGSSGGGAMPSQSSDSDSQIVIWITNIRLAADK